MLSASEFIVLLSCLASTAMSTTIDECVKGESYWCSSLENAMRCSAVKHCIATVWKNDVQDKVNEKALFDNCQLCTSFLGSMKLALQDTRMRASIKILLKEEICKMFTDYEKTCDVLVDHYADHLFDLLESEIDPDAICHFLHMCPGRDSLPMAEIKKAESMKSSSVRCDVCKMLIDQLKKVIGDGATREKIEQELEQVCKLLPQSLQYECQEIIKRYSDKIIDLLLDNLETEKICKEIHMCPETSSLSLMDKCEACEIVINFIQSLLEKNSTVEEIKATVLKTCGLLPRQYAEYCTNLIEEFADLVVQSLVDHLKPHETCMLLNMCNSAKKHERYYKCIAGPNYWCASPANAKLCEAEDHCMKFVWK